MIPIQVNQTHPGYVGYVPIVALFSLSGQSSSANEIARYLFWWIFIKNGHMIDEWIRRITDVVESLAKFYKSELVMKRWNVWNKQEVSMINQCFAVLQRPNFNKNHHSDE